MYIQHFDSAVIKSGSYFETGMLSTVSFNGPPHSRAAGARVRRGEQRLAQQLYDIEYVEAIDKGKLPQASKPGQLYMYPSESTGRSNSTLHSSYTEGTRYICT